MAAPSAPISALLAVTTDLPAAIADSSSDRPGSSRRSSAGRPGPRPRGGVRHPGRPPRLPRAASPPAPPGRPPARGAAGIPPARPCRSPAAVSSAEDIGLAAAGRGPPRWTMVAVTSVTPGARAPDGSPPGRSAPAGAPRVWKSRGRLADGREIIYFDEAPGLGRAAVPDRRQIAPQQPAGAEDGARHGLRWDPLTGEWVVVAAARQDRTFLPPAEHCPLCPSRPGRLTEIPAPGYDVVVFQNRFPALTGSPATGPGPRPPDLLPGRRPAHGRCEVVCFTSDHHRSFAGLSASRVRTVLEAWADRTAELGSLPGIRQVYCFENRGEQIGVTLHHPHGQIYAFPFVAPHTARVLEQARAYAAAGRGNLFDDLVALERG